MVEVAVNMDKRCTGNSKKISILFQI